MDPTINFDEVLDQMIDEELEDNTTRRSQRRRVVHRNREEGHDRCILQEDFILHMSFLFL